MLTSKRFIYHLAQLIMIAILLTSVGAIPSAQGQAQPPAPVLLTDPFLQMPAETSVRVAWFTEFQGVAHLVVWGDWLARHNLQELAGRKWNAAALTRLLGPEAGRPRDLSVVLANTTRLSRAREDQNSQLADGRTFTQVTERPIWRHEANVQNLPPGARRPYAVISLREDGQLAISGVFTLQPKPTAGAPLKILLTSDHQLKPMTPANLQKVVQEIGQIDAVFAAGDLVNVADRASEWFDDARGGSFFPAMQGRANLALTKGGVTTVYQGGAIIQHAPLYTAIGNHEVMGRYEINQGYDLNYQCADTVPLAAAQKLYNAFETVFNPSGDPALRARWLKDNSFNTDSYKEIFTLPGGENYYAVTFGDVRLVVLDAARIWRSPNLDAGARGKYRERDYDLNNPASWGWGEFIYEPLAQGSPQYQWLLAELAGPEFQNAPYKVIMLHHPLHSLGDNIVPAFTDPRMEIERGADGRIKAVRYEYPKYDDYLIRDLEPLFEQAGVDLVFSGHSHLWNRFVGLTGVHFIETSNVGNSYGAYLGNVHRSTIPYGYKEEYVAAGDPYGLEPVVPNIAPLIGPDNQPLPYIASNDLTVFSILDTGAGTVASYYFDTRDPNSPVVKFDEFGLGSQP